MSRIIENFYKENNIPTLLLNGKLSKFKKHEDIAKEFEYWIENNKYKTDGCIIEGYSAEALSKLSKYLDGEGAFIMMINLRENPKKTLKRICEGFKIK